MAWVIFSVPAAHRSVLDAALKDDLVSRQSQKVREGPSVDRAAGTTIVLVEGTVHAVERLGSLLGPAGSRLTGDDADRLYRRLKAEEESASAGMGLFFTEE